VESFLRSTNKRDLNGAELLSNVVFWKLFERWRILLVESISLTAQEYAVSQNTTIANNTPFNENLDPEVHAFSSEL